MTVPEISAKVSEIILIGFYREDTGEKLLIPEELAEALKQERLTREQALEQARQGESRVERLKEHFICVDVKRLVARHRLVLSLIIFSYFNLSLCDRKKTSSCTMSNR